MVFWSRLFGEESKVDDRVVRPQGMVLWGLVQTITADEIYAALQKITLWVAGFDKISRDDVRKMNLRAFLTYFNLWLCVGYFHHSCTVLVP